MSGLQTERRRRARATALVSLMLLSLLSVTPAQATGEPANLQAQGITAAFNTTTEITTITWENSDTNDATAIQGFPGAEYKVYRHNAPINAGNVDSLTSFATVDVCDMSLPLVSNNPFNCRGSTYATHNLSFPVPPGEDDSFYYAITTVLSNGTEAGEFIADEAHISTPILERTTAVQTPIVLTVEFVPMDSETTIRWYNYNDLFTGEDVHPETGDDAMSIRIWRTTYAMNRVLGASLLDTETPIATLPATATEYVVTVPANTDRTSYYSITYHLPNYSSPGVAYEDVRFLGDNTMSEPVAEDNRPPDQPVLTAANFVADPASGGGNTVLSGTASQVKRVKRTAFTARTNRSTAPWPTTCSW